MTVKERLHQMVEKLPEERAEAWLQQLRREETGESLDAFFALAEEIAENAPEEELARIPSDLSAQADHYLYGSSRPSGSSRRASSFSSGDGRGEVCGKSRESRSKVV